MSEHVLLHFSNAVPGREEEFNRWYDGTPISDAMARERAPSHVYREITPRRPQR